MSHWSLRACGSHGTTTSWISFHPLQHKQNRRKESDCVRNSKAWIAVDGWVCPAGASPACLAFLVGLWALYFLRFQVLPLDPFHPAQTPPHQKKKTINPTLRKVRCKNIEISSLLLIRIYCLTFCPSMPGKPIAPCGEREEQEGCRAGTCTAWTAALQLMSFPTLSPFAPLSPWSPREPWRANESVLHHT